jgi:hypothetical protein
MKKVFRVYNQNPFEESTIHSCQWTIESFIVDVVVASGQA